LVNGNFIFDFSKQIEKNTGPCEFSQRKVISAINTKTLILNYMKVDSQFNTELERKKEGICTNISFIRLTQQVMN
jgi:hypothetical protein